MGETLEVHRLRHLQWSPTAVVALATSPDGTSVAAARESGAIEIWNVAPGSVGWYCQLTIAGSENAAISSLVWCTSANSPLGRLFSSGLDGFITEWDLDTLQSKIQVESHGGSVWNLAARQLQLSAKANGVAQPLKDNADSDSDDESEDEDGVAATTAPAPEHDDETPEWQVAAACDDGSVRLFTVNDGINGMTFKKALPRVNGRILSVAWSADGARVFAGGSDGCIRCWSVSTSHEIYRITAGTGGQRKPGTEFCVWTLLALRDGTLVSGDSTGTTQFWDEHGTLIQALTHHGADVLALASPPSHHHVYSAGADGQVAMYTLVKQTAVKDKPLDVSVGVGETWTFLGFRRPHSHDVRALAIAVPLVQGSGQSSNLAFKKPKPGDKVIDHRSWARPGIAMLISGGNDAKLFAYSADEMLKYIPHDICPAPERPSIQLAPCLSRAGNVVFMSQHPRHVDIWKISTQHQVGEKRKRPEGSADCTNGNGVEVANGFPQQAARGQRPALLARIKLKDAGHVDCSALAGNGRYLAFSTSFKPRLFELDHTQYPWAITKKRLPPTLPAAHRLIFAADSTRLIMACAKSQVLVLQIENMELLHVFTLPVKAPVTLLCASQDGQWLAAGSSRGELTILNLEVFRQHWSVPLYDGSPATAAVFHPGHNAALILTTAANRIVVVDIQARQLGRWSKINLGNIPPQILEFPGGISGLTLSPSLKSTQMIAYSSRAMCLIDFSRPLKQQQQQQQHESCNGNGNGVHPSANGHHESKGGEKNFKVTHFDDPVLFMSYISPKSLLIVEKPWLEVLHQFPAPVYKHIYGT